MFRKIDDFLFDNPIGFQKISEFVEYYTTMRPTVQARIVAVVTLAIVAGKYWQLMMQHDPEGTLWQFLLVNFMVLIVFIQSMLIETTTKNRKFRNSYRELDAFMYLRLMFLLLFLLKIPINLMSNTEWKLFGGVGIWVVYYLFACQSLPPGEHFWSRLHKRAHA